MNLSRRDVLVIGAGAAAAAILPGCVRTVASGDGGLAAGDGAPDLIVHNAKITTLDASRPSARALAVKGGKIVAVGDDDAVLRLRTTATNVINAQGRRIIPGLNDTHTHTVRGGLNYALELRWDGVTSLKQGLQMLREQVKRTPPGQWVRVVGGWSYAQFEEKRLPTLDELNAAAPDTPVFVLYVYTSALLNKACLKYLGIDKNFPGNKYPGGTIVRDASGEPTGLLLADPSALILYSTLNDGPKLDMEQQMLSSRHFMQELNRLGITSSLDCGGGFQNWPDDYLVIKELHKRGQLTMRIGVSTFIQRPGKELEDFRTWTEQYTPRFNGKGEGDDMFYLLGGGEMLVRSAYDFEVFNMPRVVPPANAERDLEAVVRLLAEKKWPFRFHATYDETVGRHLDVLERVHRDTPISDLHWIVDHAESLSDRNIERIAAMRGGVAIQNRIAFQELPFLERYGPQAADEAPPVKRIMKAGVPVGAGTDMSRVSSYNPWACIRWLVTGKGEGGATLLSSRTRLDRETALRIWCDNGWFSREEKTKGRLSPGLLADFSLLSEDYFSVDEDRIADIESVLTIVNGRVVYGGSEFTALNPKLPELKADWSPVKHYTSWRGIRRSS
ncbi:MAG: amidohydrolase [Phycisphaerales bacterium]|nr:amidohydrolase [Phycisphaerales bacterium]